MESNSVIMKAKNLLTREWDVHTDHVYREANSVADWLANYSLTRNPSDNNSYILDDPPAGVFFTLYHDLIWVNCYSFNLVGHFALIFTQKKKYHA